jgi:N utilization substance protein A
MEVPEIFSGVVEVKAISREAGSRTKIAVLSHDENVNAISACIGVRGARIGGIVEELGGEKIDVIEYSEDPKVFIAAALSPAKVLSIDIDENGEKACRATVPDAQLSLAIGNKGQNARLAARLTGWKIDIRPESGFYGEDTED